MDTAYKQGKDKRFDFKRPKYTRDAKALEYAQVKDLEAQTLHADGTFEKHRQEVLEDNSHWLNGFTHTNKP